MRRRLDPDDRRKEILRAATRSFSTRPYDEVQIGEVAREADASRALVNHYFRDKSGLFAAVLRTIVEQTPTVVRTDLGEVGVEEMVAANTAAWLDLVEASPDTVMMLIGSGPVGRDAEIEAAQDELRDRLARRMLANHLRTDDPPAAAVLAMRAELGMIERAIRDWIGGRGGTREQTHLLIERSILATVREVIPALLAAGEEEAGT
jgi:AcrR family transcriptional regulator